MLLCYITGRVVSDSRLVEGEFSQGKLHGVGRRVLENGSVYEGEPSIGTSCMHWCAC